MLFVDLQNEVINARFKETQRASVRHWINLAYAKIWHGDDWTFRWNQDPVTVTTGSNLVTGLPADFFRCFQLQNSDGDVLMYVTPDDFNLHFGGDTSAGMPSEWTALNRQLYVGPFPSVTDTGYQILYDRAFVPLADDTDVPALPVEFHYVLVHGAMVTGLINENDFTYSLPQQAFEEGVFALKQGYVVESGRTQFKRDALGAI